MRLASPLAIALSTVALANMKVALLVGPLCTNPFRFCRKAQSSLASLIDWQFLPCTSARFSVSGLYSREMHLPSWQALPVRTSHTLVRRRRAGAGILGSMILHSDNATMTKGPI